MLASSLATLYVMDPLLVTMGLGVSVFCIYGIPWNLGVTALVVYSLLYILSLSPPWVLMSLSVWASLSCYHMEIQCIIFCIISLNEIISLFSMLPFGLVT